MSKKNIDFKALFLGAKSENYDFYKTMVDDIFADVSFWRKNYFPSDEDIITEKDKMSKNFIETQSNMKSVMDELSTRLRGGTIPWHSPRYLGHMNSETLMPGILAYFETMFYNSNNVAYESSPATSKMEDEVGKDFCNLLGYDSQKGWGHICADGSIANAEAMWYARNFKSMPFAIKKAFPELVKDKNDWQLANMSISEILEIMNKNVDKWDAIKAKTVRNDSSDISKLGKVFVPKTKHYSWLKAADILGIGVDNMICIDVDENFRMNIDILEQNILDCINKKIPILAVVAVVGTTEEGMVDHVDKVVALRQKMQKEYNVWFYFHVDSAYGGYTRALFLDENYKLIEYKNLTKYFKEYQTFENENLNWLTPDIYNAYAAISDADSVTIDPHKMGYAPYAAGGIAIKDIRMRNVISYFATYVFDTKVTIPDLLGAYMIEGSKAGATAAAVWANHKVVPLNLSGYGKLMGQSIEGAMNLYNHLQQKKSYLINNKKVNVYTLIKPDFNIVDYVFNIENNTSLDKMNELNQKIYEASCFVSGSTYTNDLILSHTNFSYDDYGLAPTGLLKRVGIVDDFKNKNVVILRSCVLSPWLYDKQVSKTYYQDFDVSITKKLQNIIK